MRINQFIRVATCTIFGHKPSWWIYTNIKRKHTHRKRVFQQCDRCGRRV